jgi:outer membrane protein TolC
MTSTLWLALPAAAPAWSTAAPDPSPLPSTAPSPASAAPAPDSGAGPERLTVEQAVRIGLAHNPQIAASQAAVAAAERNYRSLAAFPSINLAMTHILGNSTAPTLNGLTSDTFADVGDTLDTSGQRRFQAAAARAQFAAARYTDEETKLTLTQQVRDAYWSLAAARAQTQIAQEGLQDARRVYQLTSTQFEAGASPRVDVIRSSIDQANVQQSAITAQAAERTALTAFNVLLVRPAPTPADLADQLTEATVTPAAIPGLPSLPELTRTALARRPLVLAAKEQVRAAEYAVKQARAARFPDVSVDYERSLQNPTYSVLFGLRLPLLDLGSVRNSIKAAEEARKQAQAQEQQAEQQVTQQVAQAYTDYAQARELAASYQTDILSPSGTLLTAAQTGYKQGATGILPVIDAETTLRNARTGYVNSLLALYKAQDEIHAAIGEFPTPVAMAPEAGGRGEGSGVSLRTHP